MSEATLSIRVTFYSYFKELTGVTSAVQELPKGGTLGALHGRLMERFPKLAAMERSTLMAVGVDYQLRDYALKEGDEVSLFPPVQGG